MPTPTQPDPATAADTDTDAGFGRDGKKQHNDKVSGQDTP